MNRAQRRVRDKKVKGQAKQKFTLLELQKAFAIAMEMVKESRGHLFNTHMKDEKSGLELCTFCGQDRNTKDECDYERLTWMDRVQTILLNPDFFRESEAEAVYLQHGEQYQEVKIPVEYTKRQLSRFLAYIPDNNVSGVPNPSSDLDKISLQDLKLISGEYVGE